MLPEGQRGWLVVRVEAFVYGYAGMRVCGYAGMQLRRMKDKERLV
jgi:hypothetical protein